MKAHRIAHYNEKEQLHRIDGPALEGFDGSNYWYRNGKLHREDGPAIEWADGSMLWYINGKQYTEQEFNDQKLKQQLIPPEMWEM